MGLDSINREEYAVSLIIIWIFLSICIAVLAKNRGRDAVGWFVISCLISPLLSMITLLVIRNIKEEEEEQLLLYKERVRREQDRVDEDRRHQQILSAITQKSQSNSVSLKKEGDNSIMDNKYELTKQCQFCDNTLKNEAIICKYCDNILN